MTAANPVPRVGVIDSGWRMPRHARVAAGRNFVPSAQEFEIAIPTDVGDDIGHGTAVGRIILEYSSVTLVVPIRIFGRQLRASHETLFAALEWAATQRFPLINLSLTTVDQGARNRLYLICEHLLDAGTIVIASGLNGSGVGYPAVFANTIGVTLSGLPIGTRESAARRPDFDFSLSPSALKAQLAGVDSSAHPSTSAAAAFVTGIAAKVLEEHGQLTIDELRRQLESRLVALRLIESG